MDLISVILTFVGAYGVFLFLAYVLARVFFPSIEDNEKIGKHKRITKHVSDVSSLKSHI